ncbi:MAG: M24 family metallopeptidase [Actinobacteria bacterium]|nr:M24 family metallopeptidase [Actinomycetota bacterium]
MAIQIKTLDQLKSMRQANLLVRSTLELVRANIKAGITTSALDAIAEANIKRGGGSSNFKGYHGYPAVICYQGHQYQSFHLMAADLLCPQTN